MFPLLICFYLLLMNLSIDFNHQSFLVAAKVYNKPVNLVLAVKVVAAQLAIAKAPIPHPRVAPLLKSLHYPDCLHTGQISSSTSASATE